MSHPKPYLFHISRVDEQVYRRMDIQQGSVRTRCRMFAWIQECTFILLDSCMITLMYEREFVVYNIYLS